MAPPRPGITGVGQIAVTAHDVDRATAFYRDQLGLTLLFQASGMAFFDCGGVRLMIALPSAPEFDHPASIVYYRVPDLHATARELESRGVEFASKPHVVARMPDHELWMAFVRDTEGNVLGLMSEVRRGPER